MTAAIKIGALAGLSSVILVMLLGQSRVFWAMSRDGLLPPIVNRVHPKFKTPWITNIVTGIAVGIVSTLIDLGFASELVSIGTLLAFVIVSVGVLILRIRQPELPRAFKTPVIWVTAPLGAISALYLMAGLPKETWERLVIWFVIGIVIYFGYSIRHSKLNAPSTDRVPPP
jgi:APA family basic amino acid/polyamine antiporter